MIGGFSNLIPGSRVLNYSKPANAVAPLNRYLEGWWMMTPQTSGRNTVPDFSGRSNNGTLYTSAWYSGLTRPGGSGGSFDPISGFSYVDLPTPKLPAATLVTVSGWFYRHATSVQVGSGSGTTGTDYVTAIWYTDGNFYGDSGNSSYWSVAQAGTGWLHWVISFNGAGAANSDRFKVYFNGVLQTLSFTGTSSTAIPSTNTSWRLGQDQIGRYSAGRYDDHRVYVGKAFDASEAMQLYQASRTGYQNERPWPFHFDNEQIGGMSAMGL
jgi:hypothetical protein